MSWITDLIGGGASKIVDSVVTGVDKFVTSDEDRQKLQMMKAEAEFELKKLAFDAEGERLKDVSDARAMYKSDNGLQKIFAMTFLVGYIMLTIFMLWMITEWVGGQKIIVPDWGVALISTVYGQMSGKVSTIVDFLFGSSKSSSDKNETIEAMQKIPSKKAD